MVNKDRIDLWLYSFFNDVRKMLFSFVVLYVNISKGEIFVEYVVMKGIDRMCNGRGKRC